MQYFQAQLLETFPIFFLNDGTFRRLPLVLPLPAIEVEAARRNVRGCSSERIVTITRAFNISGSEPNHLISPSSIFY